MAPTLEVGDRLLAWKFSYYFRSPRRGELVIFYPPRSRRMPFVKRVVGLGGDVVELRRGQLFVNGKLIQEPYIVYRDYRSFGPYRVPAGHFFVLGDNRANSRDSRFFGAVPLRNLIGQPFVIYWPPHRFRFLRRPDGW